MLANSQTYNITHIYNLYIVKLVVDFRYYISSNGSECGGQSPPRVSLG